MDVSRLSRLPRRSTRGWWVPATMALAVSCLFGLAGCGTDHPLPAYEPPIARTEYQSVRTTAYTHTESDHVAYGNHNALGGTLHAASRPVLLASAVPAVAVPASSALDIVDEQGGFHRNPLVPHAVAPMGGQLAPVTNDYAYPPGPRVYSSAAADWSRWPAGTEFQIISTGQLYRVDDYGWALAGRNTIDLYQSTRAGMNAWGVRREQIHVLHWGDREESWRRLRRHQDYRHIRRMVLELEGKSHAAASLH